MKIDLTREEWDLLCHIIPRNIVLFKIRSTCNQKNIDLLFSILKKLGHEWIGEEEEMRKFYMGFSYKPKKWLFDDEKVKDE